MSAELVLILGAGASVPYEFPTGNVLKNWICDLRNHRGSDLGFYGSEINADYQRRKRVFEALKQLEIPEAEIESVGRMLAESKLPSIDRLVFHCAKEIGHIARLLIAAFLLDSESEIALQNPRAEGDQFSQLWPSLTAGRKSLSEVVTDKLAVFTFNYDRSLEWLLFSACKATYGVNDKAAAEFVSGVHIEHFYGATTTLHQLNNAGVKFDCDRANLHLAVERAEQEIWLIDDDRKRQESVFANASQTIGGAKIATFLGYGFDEINDGKLGVAQLIAKTKRDNIARAERLKSAPTIHHIPSGKVELHPKFILPKERSVPRFQATTLGMYEREVTSALGRSGLSRGDRDGQISTLSKNCHEALREWGTFDLLRQRSMKCPTYIHIAPLPWPATKDTWAQVLPCSIDAYRAQLLRKRPRLLGHRTIRVQPGIALNQHQMTLRVRHWVMQYTLQRHKNFALIQRHRPAFHIDAQMPIQNQQQRVTLFHP